MENAKQIALRALTGAFIERDPSVVERYFAEDYVQHNPAIPNGRAAIPGLIANLSKDFSYEPGMVAAEGDLVMVHGRYVGGGTEANDRGRYLSCGEWQVGRTLGCNAGGSGGVRDGEWQPHVWRLMSGRGATSKTT